MKPDLQRRVQRYGWDYSSPHYDAGWQRQLWPAQQRLLEEAAPEAGEAVLDISCGTGLVTFPLAEAVGGGGHVTGIDLSEKMIGEVSRRAQEAGVEQVDFRHMDAEALDLPDGRFDLAVNSLGLMYYPEPQKAVDEMHRVLREGGRAAALVWGRRKACGWADIFPVVDKRVQSDVCPLFFQLGTGEQLAHAFDQAGFGAIHSERFEVNLHYEDEEEVLTAAFLGGAVAMAYRKFDESTREAAHREYLDSVEQFKSGGEYDIPGEFVIVTGRR